jgi:hypothetical protein
MMAGKEHKQESRRRQAASIIKNLGRRGIAGAFYDTSAEAVRAICAAIAPGSLVGLGGSETLIESGLLDALRGMDLRLLDRYRPGVAKAQVDEMRLQGLLADVFIMSSNAVTADGRLVNIDGTGNRAAALIFGPKRVVVITGMNKVVPDLESAIARARHTAATANSLRVGVDTPCSHTGFCQDPRCQPPHRICCQLVITEASMTPGRLLVVLVGEDLGY